VTPVDEARVRLLRADPHYRALAAKHESYEKRLRELRAGRWLSADEQVEEIRLKKLKLAVKDEMEALARRGNAG
jgi:uncharacterized protein YdcH (DUF465 family)